MRIGFRDVALDAMLEERDHLKIRIGLIEQPGREGCRSAAAIRAALAELEERIRLHRGTSVSPEPHAPALGPPEH